MVKTNKIIRGICGIGILLALTVVLQFINNNFSFGLLSFNLAIFPIALGAIIYGPLGGFFLGLVDGGMVLLARGTEFFLAYSPLNTVFLCLLKTSLAGLIAGFIFMPFKGKKELLGTILASISVPLINTGLFILWTYLAFEGAFTGIYEGSFIAFIFIGLVGINFIIEFVVNSALSPSLYQIYKIINRQYFDGKTN